MNEKLLVLEDFNSSILFEEWLYAIREILNTPDFICC